MIILLFGFIRVFKDMEKQVLKWISDNFKNLVTE